MESQVRMGVVSVGHVWSEGRWRRKRMNGKGQCVSTVCPNPTPEPAVAYLLPNTTTVLTVTNCIYVGPQPGVHLLSASHRARGGVRGGEEGTASGEVGCASPHNEARRSGERV